MSSATAQSSGITFVAHSFILKWLLKAKQLNNLENSSNDSVIRSDLYQFKIAKDLRFYLEIGKYRYDYEIIIKGSKMWSFELSYAFLVIKDRAFILNRSDQLSFLTLYDSSDVSDEEDVTIQCVVVACPVHSDPFVEEDYLSITKGQKTIYFEGVPDVTLQSYYANKIVIDFIRRGDVPNFTVDMAIKIIRETEEHKCDVLKILSVEYLMKNITPQSIRQISKAAIDLGLSILERKCMEKIAYGHFVTK